MNQNIMTVPSYDGLVSCIYDSFFSRDPWSEALEGTRLALGSISATLRISMKGRSPREILMASGPIVSAQAIAEYENLCPHDLFPEQLRLGEPNVISLDNFGRASKLRKGLVALEVATSTAMIVDAHDEVEYILQLCRNRAQGDFTSEELALFKMLGTHFGRALKIRRNAAMSDMVKSFQSETLDRLGIGVIIVACNGRFVPLNDTAREMLANGESLRDNSGQLRTARLSDDVRFQKVLKELLVSKEDGGLRTISLKRADETELNLLLSARRSAGAVSGRQRTSALIFMRSANNTQIDFKILQSLFSFTKAEARLVSILMRGNRLDEAEDELNIRHNTARSHLRSIYAKANVSTQAELLQRLSNSLASLASKPN
jgi:DNA-binding CsgD family transcriptional regulator